MQVEYLNETRAGAWEAFVVSTADATFYHQLGWKSAMERAYGLRTHYLTAVKGARILGILPVVEMKALCSRRALISLPFTHCGGLVAADIDARNSLLSRAETLLRQGGMGYLELRQRLRCEYEGLMDKLDYHSLVLQLEADPDIVWRDRLNARVRNQCRKAEKSGLEVGEGLSLLQDFLDVYRQNLRDLGTPVHSSAWFESLVEAFRDQILLIVVYHRNRPVAGLLIFLFRDQAIVHYGASLRRYNELCPNNRSYWYAIRSCCERGLKRFDFGRSRVGSGTFHFKKQWGAIPEQSTYQYILHHSDRIPNVDPHNPNYHFAIALWRRIPLWMANAVGPLIRPHLLT